MSEAIYRIGFEQLGDVPFHSILDMARIAPDLVRLQGYRSVYGLVSRFFRDERLRAVFSFHPLLIGGDPFRAVVDLLPDRSSRKNLRRSLADRRRRRAGARARQVDRGAGRPPASATPTSGAFSSTTARLPASSSPMARRIKADIVVSNADSAWTYEHLVPARRRRRWTDARLDRARYSMGLFVWYFGVDRRYEEIGHHTILMGPRYRGLLDDIFARKKLADDFSLYLHRPTATDPSLAPPGCDTFYVLSPVPNLQGGQDWRVEAEAYRQRIAAWLEAHLLPDLSPPYRRLEARDAARLPRSSQRHARRRLRPRAVVDAKRLVPAAQRAARTCAICIWSAPACIPARACPGVLSSARVLDKVAPHARLRLTAASPAPAISAPAATRSVPARAASTPPPGCCRRACATPRSASTRSAACPTTPSICDGRRATRLGGCAARLDAAYAGRPFDHPADRAFADLVRRSRDPARVARRAV